MFASNGHVSCTQQNRQIAKDSSVSEIRVLAQHLKEHHIKNAEAYARKRMRENYAVQHEFNKIQRQEQKETFNQSNNKQKVIESLRKIPCLMKDRKNKQEGISLNRIDNMPNKYVSWIPDRGFLEYEIEEPYLIYLGDSDKERQRADDLYLKMLREYEIITKKKLPPCISDGEFEDDSDEDGKCNNIPGKFHLPDHTTTLLNQSKPKFIDKLKDIRLRAAQRFAIYHTALKFGTYPHVFSIISESLDMKDVKRTGLFFNIERQRIVESSNRLDCIKNLRIQNHQIHKALYPSYPTKVKKKKKRRRRRRRRMGRETVNGLNEDADADEYLDSNNMNTNVMSTDNETTDEDEDEDDDYENIDPYMPIHYREKDKLSFAVHNSKASEHLCRSCMVFECGLKDHKDVHRIPRKPIPDTRRDERVNKIKNVKGGQIVPCSKKCFLYTFGNRHQQWNKTRMVEYDYNSDDPHYDNDNDNDTNMNQSRPKRGSSEWSKNEIRLFRDALIIFDRDPCSLSTILGSRSCREVYEKMKDPVQEPWVHAIIQASKRPMNPKLNIKTLYNNDDDNHNSITHDGYKDDRNIENDHINVLPPVPLNSSDSDGSDASCASGQSGYPLPSKTIKKTLCAKKSLPTKKQSCISKQNKRFQFNVFTDDKHMCHDNYRNSDCGDFEHNEGNNKISRSSKEKNNNRADHDKNRETTEEKLSISCDHDGLCDEQHGCVCVSQHKYCNIRCRCNKGRHYYNENKQSFTLEDEECLQTPSFCECVAGECASDKCTCHQFGVPCTPGGCKCDSYMLPSEIGLHDRKCKNCDIIVGRHKRLFIGNSNINGIGLFAAETFKPGDVVGKYFGFRLNENNYNFATMLGEELKRTYSFDVDRSLTVDATVIGSKTRFANHGKTADRCNCNTSQIIIRGEPCNYVYATRAINPGQEVLFDYHLQGGSGKGNDWIDKLK